LAQAGVKYLDYSHLIDWPAPELTLADGSHPTAQGHRIVAAQLAQELRILDEDGE
jgi:lysophospholipase L1-like esterase